MDKALKGRERVIRLLESEAVDRAVLSEILMKYGLVDRLTKLEGRADDE